MLIKLNDLSHFLTYGHTVLDQESCKMGCKGSKDPEPKDHEQKDTESMAVRHFGLCGANLRSAKIMGAICLLYSISYLMLWIIEVSQAEKAEIFHFLAITFYVISLNAYILLIVASVKTIKQAKILLIVFMTMAIISAILGITALVFNVRDDFQLSEISPENP